LVQPRFAALLEAFRRRTGYPVLLNTSLNLRGEPIVATPADALVCAARAGLDALVLDDWVVEREMLPPGLGELLEAWHTRPRPALGAGENRSPIGEALYTFV
jgi:carbamoyltransferase